MHREFFFFFFMDHPGREKKVRGERRKGGQKRSVNTIQCCGSQTKSMQSHSSQEQRRHFPSVTMQV